MYFDNRLFLLEDFFSNKCPLNAFRLMKLPFAVRRKRFLAECRVFNLFIDLGIFFIILNERKM